MVSASGITGDMFVLRSRITVAASRLTCRSDINQRLGCCARCSRRSPARAPTLGVRTITHLSALLCRHAWRYAVHGTFEGARSRVHLNATIP